MASKRGIKCPSCKAAPKNVWIMEIYDGATFSFNQDEQGRICEEGYRSEGDLSRVQGLCNKCRHRWTLRGVVHIGQLKEKFGEFTE